jgi:NADH dehydrogenase
MSQPWKVVIVGGGFGGLSAAQHLKSERVDVTLVDRRNYHLFQPLLYQAATGSLSPGEIAAPLRGVLSGQKNARVLLGTVVDVDQESKRVFLEDGAILPYDSLIVAAGSQTSYFGNNEWQDWAPGLKSIEEATTIRPRFCTHSRSPSASPIRCSGATGSHLLSLALDLLAWNCLAP